jgi:RNA recognition motif-containing protein
MRLYVGNLPFSTTSDDLQTMFGEVGTVETATVISDRETGRSRGFAFVEMANRDEGERAVQEFNGKQLGGRALTVNEARPREERGQGGGGRQNFRGNRW